MLALLLANMLTLTFSVQDAESLEPPATEWTRTYGGTVWEEGECAVETSDGGYALAGFGFANLIKTDASGNMLWNRNYGGLAYSVVETSDGGYAMAGYYSVGFSCDFWLVKVDSHGNMQWSKTYGGDEWDMAFSVVETSDGGYALAGYTESFGVGEADVWLVKTDANGNMQWNQTYGGASSEWARSVIQTKDGGYALAGTTYSFGAGGGDFWLIIIARGTVQVRIPGDADLNGIVELRDFVLWANNFGKTVEELPPNIYPDFDNNGYVEMKDFPIWVANFGREYP